MIWEKQWKRRRRKWRKQWPSSPTSATNIWLHDTGASPPFMVPVQALCGFYVCGMCGNLLLPSSDRHGIINSCMFKQTWKEGRRLVTGLCLQRRRREQWWWVRQWEGGGRGCASMPPLPAWSRSSLLPNHSQPSFCICSMEERKTTERRSWEDGMSQAVAALSPQCQSPQAPGSMHFYILYSLSLWTNYSRWHGSDNSLCCPEKLSILLLSSTSMDDEKLGRTTCAYSKGCMRGRDGRKWKMEKKKEKKWPAVVWAEAEENIEKEWWLSHASHALGSVSASPLLLPGRQGREEMRKISEEGITLWHSSQTCGMGKTRQPSQPKFTAVRREGRKISFSGSSPPNISLCLYVVWKALIMAAKAWEALAAIQLTIWNLCEGKTLFWTVHCWPFCYSSMVIGRRKSRRKEMKKAALQHISCNMEGDDGGVFVLFYPPCSLPMEDVLLPCICVKEEEEHYSSRLALHDWLRGWLCVVILCLLHASMPLWLCRQANLRQGCVAFLPTTCKQPVSMPGHATTPYHYLSLQTCVYVTFGGVLFGVAWRRKRTLHSHACILSHGSYSSLSDQWEEGGGWRLSFIWMEGEEGEGGGELSRRKAQTSEKTPDFCYVDHCSSPTTMPSVPHPLKQAKTCT